MHMRLAALLASALILMLSFATGAQAIPTLQVYLEGAEYDAATETWTLSDSGTFNLWVGAQWSGGETGVYDVKLSAAVATSETGTITLTPTTTSVAGLTDSSVPLTPIVNASPPDTDGGVPITGDGTPLPTHGVYGPGTSYFEWALGDFTTQDSNVADLNGATVFPNPYPTNVNGQLNVYSVTVTGFTTVHFDAYDHVVISNNRTRYVFAPFSHDGEARVPEPGTLLLLGTGLFGLGLLMWRKRS